MPQRQRVGLSFDDEQDAGFGSFADPIPTIGRKLLSLRPKTPLFRDQVRTKLDGDLQTCFVAVSESDRAVKLHHPVALQEVQGKPFMICECLYGQWTAVLPFVGCAHCK